MLQFGLVIGLRRLRAEQPLGVLVDEGRFAVHVGHVDEGPALDRQRLIRAGAHRLLRQGQRHRVAGEGQRRAAVDVPGELVEHDDLGQPSLRLLAPRGQLARVGGLMQRAELRADALVERGVDAPPLRRLEFLEPEGQDDVVRHGRGLR